MFYTHSHFSKATYYKFFITDIFSNYTKVISAKTILQSMFSVTNTEDRKHKQITILDFKIKIKVKQKNAQ